MLGGHSGIPLTPGGDRLWQGMLDIISKSRFYLEILSQQIRWKGNLGVIPNSSIRLPHAQACTCIFTHTHETGEKRKEIPCPAGSGGTCL